MATRTPTPTVSALTPEEQAEYERLTQLLGGEVAPPNLGGAAAPAATPGPTAGPSAAASPVAGTFTAPTAGGAGGNAQALLAALIALKGVPPSQKRVDELRSDTMEYRWGDNSYVRVGTDMEGNQFIEGSALEDLSAGGPAPQFFNPTEPLGVYEPATGQARVAYQPPPTPTPPDLQTTQRGGIIRTVRPEEQVGPIWGPTPQPRLQTVTREILDTGPGFVVERDPVTGRIEQNVYDPDAFARAQVQEKLGRAYQEAQLDLQRGRLSLDQAIARMQEATERARLELQHTQNELTQRGQEVLQRGQDVEQRGQELDTSTSLAQTGTNAMVQSLPFLAPAGTSEVLGRAIGAIGRGLAPNEPLPTAPFPFNPAQLPIQLFAQAMAGFSPTAAQQAGMAPGSVPFQAPRVAPVPQMELTPPNLGPRIFG